MASASVSCSNSFQLPISGTCSLRIDHMVVVLSAGKMEANSNLPTVLGAPKYDVVACHHIKMMIVNFSFPGFPIKEWQKEILMISLCEIESDHIYFWSVKCP